MRALAPQKPPLAALIQMKKLEVEDKKVEVQLARQKVEQIKAIKEVAEAKASARQMLMELVQEIIPDRSASVSVTKGNGGNA